MPRKVWPVAAGPVDDDMGRVLAIFSDPVEAATFAASPLARQQAGADGEPRVREWRVFASVAQLLAWETPPPPVL
jgi:hypothetical protein